MLRATFDRLAGIGDLAEPLVVCNVDHHHLVAAELDAAGFDQERVVLEPVGQNTAPAAAAAAVLLDEDGTDPILLVLPADHLIRDEDAFHKAVKIAAAQAAEGKLVTFGIVPAYAETGYGYIRAGAGLGDDVAELAEFVEKPDLATAERYVADGNYRWNSGMFVFRSSRYLAELNRRNPEMVKAAHAAVEAADRRRGIRLDPAAFTASPANSIDFAVMEDTVSGIVVSLDAGWSDVGSWAALWEATERDSLGNVIVGDVTAIDTRESYLRSESRLLTTLGVEDMVVVETADAVLVAPRHRAQDVKEMVKDLKEAARIETERHRSRTTRFGTVLELSHGDGFRVIQLSIATGRRMSSRRHDHRAERWVVERGTGVVVVDGDQSTVAAGDTVFIPAGTIHHVANPSSELLVLIEIQLGNRLADDDTDVLDDLPGPPSS